MIASRRDFIKSSAIFSVSTGITPFVSPINLDSKVMEEISCDILVAGGSFGGVSAAIAAAKQGKRVIMTEETTWIGGQATTQGVPLDEHPWIEQYGINQSYKTFRDSIRDYYRKYYPLSYSAQKDPFLNPGAAWVTALGYEPPVGQAVLYQMMSPFITAGKIRILTKHKPLKVTSKGDLIQSVTFEDLNFGVQRQINASITIDATELGDLLELGKVEHVIGAEPQSETQEPNAYGEGDPLRQQPFTHLIAVDYLPGEDYTITRPKDYEKYRDRFKGTVGSLPNEEDEIKIRFKRLFAPDDPSKYESTIWNFRRYFCKSNFQPGVFPSDVTSIMTGEYRAGQLVGVSDKEAQHHREQAKQLTLSAIYYYQTEIENGYQGKPGFPGIRPRGDMFGTIDGLAQYPYIRESRRIKADFTVLEQHFHIDMNPRSPIKYEDSVGVAGYRIDIHEKRKQTSFTQELHNKHWPQQIPLGCLIPQRVENMLAGCKNVGTTHITNGAFRLHPVEWNIGEAAGALAAYCLTKNIKPKEVRANKIHLQDFQRLLVQQGVELDWPRLEHGRSYNSHFVDVPDWYWGEANLKY